MRLTTRVYYWTPFQFAQNEFDITGEYLGKNHRIINLIKLTNDMRLRVFNTLQEKFLFKVEQIYKISTF